MKILRKESLENDKTTIKVWGYSNKGGEANFRVHMFAEIKTFSLGLL